MDNNKHFESGVKKKTIKMKLDHTDLTATASKTKSPFLSSSDDTINWACRDWGKFFRAFVYSSKGDTAQNDDAKCQNIWALQTRGPQGGLTQHDWPNPCALILAHSWPSSPEKVFSGSRNIVLFRLKLCTHTQPSSSPVIIPRTGPSRESSHHIAAETRAVDCSSDLGTHCAAPFSTIVFRYPPGFDWLNALLCFGEGVKKS